MPISLFHKWRNSFKYYCNLLCKHDAMKDLGGCPPLGKFMPPPMCIPDMPESMKGSRVTTQTNDFSNHLHLFYVWLNSHDVPLKKKIRKVENCSTTDTNKWLPVV